MTEYIVRDGETGLAMVSSTSTLVDDILHAIEAEGTLEAALRLDPRLTEEAVLAALRFARVAVRNGGMFPPPDPTLGVMELRERQVHPDGGTATLDRYEEDDDRVQAPRTLQDSLKHAEERREQLLYELDLIESIRDGLQDIIDGNTISHEEAVAWLRARIPG